MGIPLEGVLNTYQSITTLVSLPALFSVLTFPLRELVDLHCGNATEIVASLRGPFDCIFFDADRYSAPAQLSLLIPKLTPDVLLLADNVLSHPNEIAGYLQALEVMPQLDPIVIPIGKGLSIAYHSAKN